MLQLQALKRLFDASIDRRTNTLIRYADPYIYLRSRQFKRRMNEKKHNAGVKV